MASLPHANTTRHLTISMRLGILLVLGALVALSEADDRYVSRQEFDVIQGKPFPLNFLNKFSI